MMVGRSTACATPAELGHDLRPEPAETPDPERSHEIERTQVPEDAERYPGYPFEQCRHCGASGRVGSIEPYEECPADGENRDERAEPDAGRTGEIEA